MFHTVILSFAQFLFTPWTVIHRLPHFPQQNYSTHGRRTVADDAWPQTLLVRAFLRFEKSDDDFPQIQMYVAKHVILALSTRDCLRALLRLALRVVLQRRLNGSWIDDTCKVWRCIFKKTTSEIAKSMHRVYSKHQ